MTLLWYAKYFEIITRSHTQPYSFVLPSTLFWVYCHSCLMLRSTVSKLLSRHSSALKFSSVLVLLRAWAVWGRQKVMFIILVGSFIVYSGVVISIIILGIVWGGGEFLTDSFGIRGWSGIKLKCMLTPPPRSFTLVLAGYQVSFSLEMWDRGADHSQVGQ